ncbi:MAG: O-antigen ligase family protein [Alphaproteobacteria bacterium]
MTINVLGLVLAPSLSMSADGAATGLFSHKNRAGQFTLVSYLIWLVAAFVNRDIRHRLIFLGGAMVWFGFLVLTQSKTSLAIAAVAPFAMVVALRILHAEGLVRVAMVSLLLGLAGVTWFWLLGAGITTEDIALLAFGDLTFTGRTGLWEYLWQEVANHPIKGFGYGSFWHTGLRSSPINFAEGWVAVAGQAHNGYLDLVVQTGFIGLALAVIAILRSLGLVMILVSRQGLSIEERSAYVLSLVLLGAILLLNFMESSYFRNNNYLSVLFILNYFMIETWSVRSARSPTV